MKGATMLPNPNHPSLELWQEAYEELLDLGNRKRGDYGNVDHPFANVVASAEFGIPPWVGSVIRMNDKVHRLKSFVRNGRLENESVEDSLIDIANYALIALALYRETT